MMMKFAMFAACAVTATMLSGCNMPRVQTRCYDASFPDKNGLDVKVSDHRDEEIKYTCGHTDLAKEDGYVRRFQKYEYKEAKGFECRKFAKGKHAEHNSGEDSDGITDSVRYYWVTKDGRRASSVPGECIKAEIGTYETCGDEEKSGSDYGCSRYKTGCYKMMESKKNVPAWAVKTKEDGKWDDMACCEKRTEEDGCKESTNGCYTCECRCKKAEDDQPAKKDERLYGQTGWLFHADPLSTNLALGGVVMAGIAGLVVSVRRTRAMHDRQLLEATDAEVQAEE